MSKKFFAHGVSDEEDENTIRFVNSTLFFDYGTKMPNTDTFVKVLWKLPAFHWLLDINRLVKNIDFWKLRYDKKCRELKNEMHFYCSD